MPGLVVLGDDQRPLRRLLARWRRRDFKYVIGYSSVSHMGYVLMGLATMNPIGINGAALQMFSHGVMTALLFSMVGAVYDQAHTRDLRGLRRPGEQDAAVRRSSSSSPASPRSACRASPASSPSSTSSSARSRRIRCAGALAILGAGITAIYIFRLLALSFFGSFNEQRWGWLKDMTKFEMAGGALLIVFILFMGLWPAPFVDRISPTIVDFVLRAG